jgi:hypothetical protein
VRRTYFRPAVTGAPWWRTGCSKTSAMPVRGVTRHASCATQWSERC